MDDDNRFDRTDAQIDALAEALPHVEAQHDVAGAVESGRRVAREGGPAVSRL